MSGARVAELEAQVSGLAVKLKETESALDAARQRLSEAEKAAESATQRAQSYRNDIETEISARHQAKLNAAQGAVAEMEAKLAAETKRRKEAEARDSRATEQVAASVMSHNAPGIASRMTPEDEVDPDALMSEIKETSFGKLLSVSLLAHVCIILLTSVGYIVWLARGKPEKAPPQESETSAASVSQEPEAKANASAPREPETETNASEQAPGSDEGREQTTLEQHLESVPEEGEAKPETSVSLGLD